MPLPSAHPPLTVHGLHPWGAGVTLARSFSQPTLFGVLRTPLPMGARSPLFPREPTAGLGETKPKGPTCHLRVAPPVTCPHSAAGPFGGSRPQGCALWEERGHPQQKRVP